MKRRTTRKAAVAKKAGKKAGKAKKSVRPRKPDPAELQQQVEGLARTVEGMQNEIRLQQIETDKAHQDIQNILSNIGRERRRLINLEQNAKEMKPDALKAAIDSVEAICDAIRRKVEEQQRCLDDRISRMPDVPTSLIAMNKRICRMESAVASFEKESKLRSTDEGVAQARSLFKKIFG